MAKATVGINFVITQGANGMHQLTVQAKDLRDVMQQTMRITRKLSHETVGFSLLSTGLRNFAEATSQLQNALNSLAEERNQFDTAMKAANTMAGKGTEEFNKMKDSVAALAKEIPVARDLLANGLYQTISNGVPEANWLTFLRDSARSSVGGIANLEKVVGVTATIIKNYGLQWEEAAKIQDKIQLTAKNGVTSFEQLAAALPKVTGNAATLGVSIDELMATFATLTGVSGNTAEVSTQLAAIFSALVKPSSEASKMAAEMGIQFDAASVKAAGGLKMFLNYLDASVKEYSASAGVLEQEVYGKLFGSAESLRALVPLQGKLADTFSTNIETMKDSAGTMDAAFREMAATGESTTQLLRNKWAALTDSITEFAAKIAPVFDFAAPIFNSASSIAILITSFKGLHIQQSLCALSAKALGVAQLDWRRVGVTCVAMGRALTLTLRGMTVGASTAAVAMRGLKAAIRGVLIMSGVGAAVWAVAEVINYLADSADKASASLDDVTEAEERVRRRSEEAAAAERDVQKAREDAESQLSVHIATLKNFNGTQDEEKRIVDELNSAYGSRMGYFSSVSDWYKALVANSQTYCRQMVLEAQISQRAQRMAAINSDIEDIAGKEGNRKLYSKNRKAYMRKADKLDKESLQKLLKLGDFVYEDGVVWRKSEWDYAQDALMKLKAEREQIRKQMEKEAKEVASLKLPVVGEIKNPLTVNAPEGDGKGKKKKKKGTGGSTKTEPEWTDSPETIKQFRDNIKLLQDLKETADEVSIAGINQLIEQYDEAATRLEKLGTSSDKTTRTWHDQAVTLKDIEENLSILNSLLQEAETKEDAMGFNILIEQHEKLAESIRKAGRSDESHIAKLNEKAVTLKDISGNIEYWRNQLEKANVSEAAGINRSIAMWEKRAEAIRNAGTQSISAAEAIGNAWGEIKNLKGTVSSIMSGFDAEASVWERLTGLVDGFVAAFDGVRGVIALITQMSEAMGALNAVRKAGTAATEADTVATAANTIETSVNTAEAAANTAVKSGEAVAEATASGAKLPFPANLAAIASGLSAVMGALMFVGKFATGGIVGGNSPSGDRLFARVNSGEMILNMTQQRRLFDFLNGAGSLRGVSAPQLTRVNPTAADLRGLLREPSGGGQGGTVRFTLEGRTLVGVLANETRIAGKSGRRTNISL